MGMAGSQIVQAGVVVKTFEIFDEIQFNPEHGIDSLFETI